jgi:predicted MFS family arabinose efflux permease
MFGSMSLVVPQTAVPRVIPNEALGRVNALFLAGQAAATLAGALAGPFVAQSAGLAGLAAAASLVTFGAAVLARLTVPLYPVSGFKAERVQEIAASPARGRIGKRTHAPSRRSGIIDL